MVLPGTLPAAQPPPPAPQPRRSAADKLKWRIGIGIGVAGVLVFLKIVWGGLNVLSGGSYEFMAMQGDEPVTWNHCQAIRYQVNPKGAPEDWQEIVHKAVGEVEAASGFVFADRGTSVKTGLIGTRYDGNEWEPVLIMWSDRYQDGSLDGGVIGRGGGGTIEVNGRVRYVVGKVSLDSNVRDPKVTQMVLEHELGHVLGLDHTGDASQLMYAGYVGQDGFGKGDINGLHRLHDVPCDGASS